MEVSAGCFLKLFLYKGKHWWKVVLTVSKPRCISHSCTSLTQMMTPFESFLEHIHKWAFLNLKFKTTCQLSFTGQEKIKSERKVELKLRDYCKYARREGNRWKDEKEDLMCLWWGAREGAWFWNLNSVWNEWDSRI